ncbi:hypothetical protein [Streptomyces sp. NPDC051016]|uniref:hypothetical protein n=1 Tax=Streptomyces sp. NPDC051016 TaxID=3365638 RepID=UPI0037881D43
MTWTSRVPDAVDALFAALSAAPEFEKAAVWDGPQVSKATPQKVLSVAFTGDEAADDVESTNSAEGLGGKVDREQFTIRCATAVLVGSTKASDARRQAYEMFAAVGAVLARDPKLGGAVMRARLGTHTFRNVQTSSGAQAVVFFGVDCDAYTGR